ncbi:hypothetical protein MP228_011112 [Amoeboaphelidium protococcarum]|nr:hypothetical protein MP228_011112 [Amoeboaphelidium protococcarum]
MADEPRNCNSNRQNVTPQDQVHSKLTAGHGPPVPGGRAKALDLSNGSIQRAQTDKLRNILNIALGKDHRPHAFRYLNNGPVVVIKRMDRSRYMSVSPSV